MYLRELETSFRISHYLLISCVAIHFTVCTCESLCYVILSIWEAEFQQGVHPIETQIHHWSSHNSHDTVSILHFQIQSIGRADSKLFLQPQQLQVLFSGAVFYKGYTCSIRTTCSCCLMIEIHMLRSHRYHHMIDNDQKAHNKTVVYLEQKCSWVIGLTQRCWNSHGSAHFLILFFNLIFQRNISIAQGVLRDRNIMKHM